MILVIVAAVIKNRLCSLAIFVFICTGLFRF